jgi:hypothetical protein
MSHKSPDQAVAQEGIVERSVLDDDCGSRHFPQELRPHLQRAIGYLVDPVEYPLLIIGGAEGCRSGNASVVITQGRS